LKLRRSERDFRCTPGWYYQASFVLSFTRWFEDGSKLPIRPIRERLRCFADQNHARLADPLQNFAIICFA
jgi:hypothetical protein